jgi:glycosidase
MKKNKIQLMVYGENLSDYKASANSSKIVVKKIYSIENKNYSFVDISIMPGIKPGNYKLSFAKGKETVNVDFPILKREKSGKRFQGFNAEDIVYLIMPDRFADGDTSNNKIDGMINDFKRGDPLARHGGDLQGIINHLSNLNNLGVNALWLTPVIENNHPISYHGYAATDLYKIDPRLGTNEKYKEFVESAHQQEIKVIFDHVNNHISINHPWMQNPPTPDWFNGTKENHLNAWHDKAVSWDIHKEQITIDHLTKGWFVDEMPDLNQNNIFVKNYLIQNTIWWIEYACMDGIREDTYPYITPQFSSEWAKEVLNEYPTFNIVGEVWSGETVILAPYQKGSKLNKGLDTNLPVVTDFALSDAYRMYLNGKSDLYSIYKVIAQDYLYVNPNNLLTFVDNHDVARTMFEAKGDVAKVKLVFTHLLTSRGIPQILYGTEIGIVGSENHGYLRADFRGGFPGDESSAFDSIGRTTYENDLFSFFKKIIELRKKYKSLSSGELKHLAPINNVYIYAKEFKNEKMLIMLNGDNLKKEVDGNIIENVCGKIMKLYDVVNKTYSNIIDGKFIIEPLSANVFLIE